MPARPQAAIYPTGLPDLAIHATWRLGKPCWSSPKLPQQDKVVGAEASELVTNACMHVQRSAVQCITYRKYQTRSIAPFTSYFAIPISHMTLFYYESLCFILTTLFISRT